MVVFVASSSRRIVTPPCHVAHAFLWLHTYSTSAGDVVQLALPALSLPVDRMYNTLGCSFYTTGDFWHMHGCFPCFFRGIMVVFPIAQNTPKTCLCTCIRHCPVSLPVPVSALRAYCPDARHMEAHAIPHHGPQSQGYKSFLVPCSFPLQLDVGLDASTMLHSRYSQPTTTQLVYHCQPHQNYNTLDS